MTRAVVDEGVKTSSLMDDDQSARRLLPSLERINEGTNPPRLFKSCVAFCGRGRREASTDQSLPVINSSNSSSSNKSYNPRTCCVMCRRQLGPAACPRLGRMMVLMVLVLAAGDMVRQAEGAAVPGFQHVPAAAHLRDSGQKDDPLARLSKVFGISRIPARVVHRTPPQYMTELYQAVADTRSGLTKANGPYNANTIRSFPDRGEYLVLLLCST